MVWERGSISDIFHLTNIFFASKTTEGLSTTRYRCQIISGANIEEKKGMYEEIVEVLYRKKMKTVSWNPFYPRIFSLLINALLR